VHCAERIVDTRSWKAFSCLSSQAAFGYASSSFARIAETRLGSVPAARGPLDDLPGFFCFEPDLPGLALFACGFFFGLLAMAEKL